LRTGTQRRANFDSIIGPIGDRLHGYYLSVLFSILPSMTSEPSGNGTSGEARTPRVRFAFISRPFYFYAGPFPQASCFRMKSFAQSTTSPPPPAIRGQAEDDRSPAISSCLLPTVDFDTQAVEHPFFLHFLTPRAKSILKDLTNMPLPIDHLPWVCLQSTRASSENPFFLRPTSYVLKPGRTIQGTFTGSPLDGVDRNSMFNESSPRNSIFFLNFSPPD